MTSITLPGVVITQFNMWSFLILLGLWLRSLHREGEKSKFEISTTIAMLSYTMVIILEAVYLASLLILKEDQSYFGVINKVAELGSLVILIHFVLELYFVVMLIMSQSNSSVPYPLQQSKVRSYRRFYLFSMLFSTAYSLVILAARSIHYISPQTFHESEAVRIAEFCALTAKFLFECLILSIFTLTLWRLVRIKRRQNAFTGK